MKESLAKTLLEGLYRDFELEDGASRREILIQDMEEVSQKGHGCASCVGHCCTYEFNSMQVDPLQALELYVFISQKFDASIWDDIESNIKEYRLDKFFQTGKDVYLRRYYTCPFYKKSNLGCPISRKSKPYGCLAFNALQANVSTPGFCESSQNILKKREDLFEKKEDAANKFLIGALDLYWSKLPMPLALKELRFQLNRKKA